MKFRINLFITLIYVACFYKIIIESITALSGLGSIIMVLINVAMLYLGLKYFSKLNKFYVSAFAIILFVSFLNYIMNDSQIVTHIHGLCDVANLVFAISFLDYVFKTPYRDYLNSKIRKFAYIFLIAQLPVTIFQFLRDGAGDTVGGTLGQGGTGVLTLMVVMLSYYVILSKFSETKAENNIKKLKVIGLYSIFLLPIFINETKISFILVPIMFVTLFRVTKLKNLLAIGSLSVLFFFVFTNYYSDKGTSYSNPVTEIFNTDFLETYLAGDDEYFDDIPRFKKIVLSATILGKQSGTLILGEDYGAFKGGTTIEKSKFAKDYNWLLLGSRPYVFDLFIMGGLALLSIVLLIIIRCFRSDPFPKQGVRHKGFLLFLSLVFALVMIYNDAPIFQGFTLIFIYLTYFSKYYKFMKAR